MLAIHKDVQQKLIDEIDSICGAEMELTFNNEFLHRFKYLTLVINETLRLFPTAPIVGRETSEEINICGYTVPKNITILMSLFEMQRDEKYWGDDRHLFRPERLEKILTPLAWMPFTGEF